MVWRFWALVGVSVVFLTAANADSGPDPHAAAAGLDDITHQLNASVKRYYALLDKLLDQQDRGYRGPGNRIVPSADADLNSGAADVMWAAARKFAAFRMMASRNEKYAPAAAAELDRIQELITAAHDSVNASTKLLRTMAVISRDDLDLHKPALNRARRDRDHLLNSRASAEEAAARALMALPMEQGVTESAEEMAQKVWDTMGRAIPANRKSPQTAAAVPASLQAKPDALPPFPMQIERRKRVTVLKEPSYRMAITDSGIQDGQGRHIFYQEEWAQRGPSVMRFRWRVAVETATGEHVMLKRYAPIELHGTIDDLYSHRDRDYVWYLEPEEGSAPPARGQVEMALDRVAMASDAMQSTEQDFRAIIRDRMAGAPLLDVALSTSLREKLFVIRAHLARAPYLMVAEQSLRAAAANVETAIRELEPLAAWSNRLSGDIGTADRPQAFSPAMWTQMLDRSDRAINAARLAESHATALLPPDPSLSEETFPAMADNLIVRIRLVHPKYRAYPNAEPPVRCLQEIWAVESRMQGVREVRRIDTLFLIDTGSGAQTRYSSGSAVYRISPGMALEEIYDEYAADDVSMGS